MRKITVVVLMLFTALSYAQDIKLNGTVSAQNNQIKNVANPTEALTLATILPICIFTSSDLFSYPTDR